MSDELIAEAQQRALAGDLQGAAPIFERLAQLRRDPAEQVQALISAARLRMMLDEPAYAATLLQQARTIAPPQQHAALLRAEAECADAQGDLDARRAAWEAVLAVTQGADAVSAARKRAAIEKAQDKGEAMLPWLAVAIDHAQGEALQDARIDALLERAAVYLNLQKPALAQADLQTTAGLLTDEPSSFRARHTGLGALVSHARGDLPGARLQAVEARALAVACRDVPSYLSATMMLMAIDEQAGDMVQAYDTLIRARESLRDLLGDDGASLVQPALSAFEARNAGQLDAIHAAWVEQRQT
jgi:hypothetical protein